jgi:hypothetical protein
VPELHPAIHEYPVTDRNSRSRVVPLLISTVFVPPFGQAAAVVMAWTEAESLQHRNPCSATDLVKGAIQLIVGQGERVDCVDMDLQGGERDEVREMSKIRAATANKRHWGCTGIQQEDCHQHENRSHRVK